MKPQPLAYKSPFNFGSTVSVKSFTNREDDTAKLYNNLTGGINTMLISPRRWGKSSLVEKVICEINKKETKHRTVSIDLFTTGSKEEFLEIFAKEVIKASSSKWEDWVNTVKDVFKAIVPKVNVGIDPQNDFSLSFDWQDLNKHQSEILDLPEKLAIQKNIKMIICLDEFQNLASFSDFKILEKQMRSVWQRHKNVCYCLYGSKRHMMSDIFDKPRRPFYRFGDLMLLEKIKTDKWVSFICESFKNTGKRIDIETAKLIPTLMKDHSWYVQQLAHYTWNLSNSKATKDDILKALEEVINANSPLYQREIEILSPTQINLLKAVSKKETKFTSTKVMQTYRLGTPNNVSKNRKILANNDIINKTKTHYEFLDPAFELWFKKQFFNQDFLKI